MVARGPGEHPLTHVGANPDPGTEPAISAMISLHSEISFRIFLSISLKVG